MTPCRFCGNEAIALVALDQGCLCYPNDREQWLCWQHLERATPLGSITVKEALVDLGKS